jgi:hypothetical protein
MPDKNIRGIFAKTVTPHVSFWFIEDQISSQIKVVGLLYHVLPFLGVNYHIEDKFVGLPV